MSSFGMPAGGGHLTRGATRKPAGRGTVIVAILVILTVVGGGGTLASVSFSNRLASAKRDLNQKIQRSSSELNNQVAGALQISVALALVPAT